MILLSDPRIADIRVADNGDGLVDLRTVPELRLDDRLADDSGAFAMVRRHVLLRLLDAQSALPEGLRLLIVEAYRPLDLQRSYFEAYQDELRALHPRWSADRLHAEASKYVSPPQVAPHSTGGTVDLTLCTSDGVELDMGTAVNASPEASDNTCFTAARAIPARARRNRRVLVTALSAVGMINYPTEWWHWSYGDRYWAHVTGCGTTLYAPVQLVRGVSSDAPSRAMLW
ncbi:MAG: M15 family metallopeptidase [Kutzneria sp.]|nr:M15 family metallopeptidase [Kutzneria sp.]MBV9843879.1 M15 family metallopeptidase [Kutzneria sp.]